MEVYGNMLRVAQLVSGGAVECAQLQRPQHAPETQCKSGEEKYAWKSKNS